jgi:hypothetical protein
VSFSHFLLFVKRYTLLTIILFYFILHFQFLSFLSFFCLARSIANPDRKQTSINK